MRQLEINLPDNFDAAEVYFYCACLFIEKFNITLEDAAMVAKLTNTEFREKYKNVKNSSKLLQNLALQ